MTINCKGRLIDLATPKVMGILNLTPDSFYDGGRNDSDQAILDKVGRMLDEGAQFIDVGGYSSRPGAAAIGANEEEGRIFPAIEMLVRQYPDVLISVDTFRASVARSAVGAGAALVNDISAGWLDDDMMATVGTLHVPYIMMHMKGTPQTMASLAEYENLTGDILQYFAERIGEARRHGISDIVLDPGFGFAKTVAQNFELLGKMKELQVAGLPVLAGLSRKSTIYKTLDVTADDALNGTSVLNTIALMNGANILRVHDVKEAVECVKLFNEIPLA